MIEYLKYFVVFLYVWFTTFIWHEFGHGLDNHRQTGMFGKIGVSLRHLTMWHETDGYIADMSMYFLMGGLFSGLLHIGIGLICADTIFRFGFFTTGLVNLVYGFFEWHFLPKWGNNTKYKIGRYAIYVSLVTVMVIVWVWVI